VDKGTTFVALDNSKRKVVVAILRPGATEPEQRELAKEPQQNSSPGSLTNPQAPHARASAVLHVAQKRRPSRFSAWHRGHGVRASPERRENASRLT
jgi:hypothetical protein